MLIELGCPSCGCSFKAPPDTPYGKVLDQMIDEGPWIGLAEGDTFEDMIFAALTTRGVIRCPDCSEPITISEESLAGCTEEPYACY
jgi:hypothetical protein